MDTTRLAVDSTKLLFVPVLESARSNSRRALHARFALTQANDTACELWRIDLDAPAREWCRNMLPPLNVGRIETVRRPSSTATAAATGTAHKRSKFDKKMLLERRGRGQRRATALRLGPIHPAERAT